MSVQIAINSNKVLGMGPEQGMVVHVVGKVCYVTILSSKDNCAYTWPKKTVSIVLESIGLTF